MRKFSLLVIITFHLSLFQTLHAQQKKDLKLADNYKKKADEFNLNRQRDSSVVYYKNAVEIYRSYIKKKEDSEVLKKYIDCLNNYSYDLIYTGELDKGIKIAEKSKELILHYFGDNNIYIARSLLSIGYYYDNNQQFEEAIDFYNKALTIYGEIGDTNNIYVARIYSNTGIIFYYYGMYDVALEYSIASLNLLKNLYGENSTNSAALHNVVGVILDESGDREQGLQYKLKALKIFKSLYGENSIDVANVELNLGASYEELMQSENTVSHYQKALATYKELKGKESEEVADVYNNLGVAYDHMGKYELALEYYLISRDLYESNLGKKHLKVARIYNNIGVVYDKKGEPELAIDYYNKALVIRKEILGEGNPDVLILYDNLAVSYIEKNEIETAIKYLEKSLNLYEELFGEQNIRQSYALLNIGLAYKKKGDLDKAMEYYIASLDVRQNYYGAKHPEIAEIYNNIAGIYAVKEEFNKSLEYYQKALIAQIKDFNDSDIHSFPNINNSENKELLLLTMQNKAGILRFQDTEESLLLAFENVKYCDTLINIIRNSTVNNKDKLAVAANANELYRLAIGICIRLSETLTEVEEIEKYKNEAFHFSEKNKSNILLEAIAGTEAKNFAGIPDSVLKIEDEIKSFIAYYEKQLAVEKDSSLVVTYRNKLFQYNRRLDSLAADLEKEYPRFYDLKYNVTPLNLEEIQKTIDSNTAILSYTMIDTLIVKFIITKEDLKIQFSDTISDLSNKIKKYRKSLIYNKSDMYTELYSQFAHKLYNRLIPDNIDDNIKSLIIIPDEEMALIPFETFLTEKEDNMNWTEFSYLINKYDISYSYSVGLFCKTHPKEKDQIIERTNLNDWLALAPVFDNSEDAHVTLRTREFLRSTDSLMTDGGVTRSSLITEGYISPIPGTIKEVESIFKEFENKGKKAIVQINNSANEDYVKSGNIEKFKFLHFATHGFVNTDNPDLSGILLAQNSSSSEDGILYSGEIYNLKLNADLTVLSACETGLGKIRKGEGIIGLTRALLYAGSKNIIVSLWKVSDESTTNLMIDFYNQVLENEDINESYSASLRKAKLRMIQNEEYSHPFYWSPFILIGK